MSSVKLPENQDLIPETAAPVSVLHYEAVVGKRWVVGTLSYTTVGLAVLFGWLLLGDFSQNMKERSIFPVAMLMLRGFNAPDWLVGLLVASVPAGIGVFLCPAIGVMSDRHRGRLGRRIPFILWSTPPIMLSMMAIGMSGDVGAWLHRMIGGQASLNICRIGVFAVFWSALEIGSIIANSLFGCLVNDVVPQPVIGRCFGLFRVVGLFAGAVFNWSIMGHAAAHFELTFGGLGLLYGVSFILMCVFVKEGDYPPPEPTPPGRSFADFFKPVVAYLRECFGNPFFLSFFLSTTLGGLALGPVNTFAIFHGHSVNMSDQMYGNCLALSSLISMALAFPLGALADRFHPLRIGIVTMTLYAVVTGFGFFYADNARRFFVALLLHTVISGCFITGNASIAQRLLPRSKFAEICAAGGIIGAVIGMFFSPLLGLFIQHMNHQYRYVFVLASGLSIVTVVSYWLLLRQYLARGGDRGFVPPE
jgi:MFS family permease